MASATRPSPLRRHTALTVIGILMLWIPAAAQPQPSYGGKTATAWARQLRDRNVEKANEALKALAAIGAPAVPTLVPMLTDKDYQLRVRAAAVFTQMGSSAVAAVPALLDAINDPRAGVSEHSAHRSVTMSSADPAAQQLRAAILVCLGIMGEPAVPALVEGLKHPSQLIRVGAAEVLDATDRVLPDAMASLAAAVIDPHPRLRASAGRLLVALGDNGIPAILQALAHTEASVRSSAAESLGELNPLPESTKAALVDALKDTDKQVQFGAAFALARHRVVEAVPILAGALKDESTEAADFLTGVDRDLGKMGAMTGTLSGLAQQLERADADRRLRAATALGNMGAVAVDAIPALTRALQDKSTEVREAAAAALRKIQTPKGSQP